MPRREAYARSRRLRALTATVAALALPAPALAETITFDGLAAGTVLTNQYADVGGAGQGVTFGPLPGGVASPIYRPVIIALPGQAHSGTQAANISTCQGESCAFVPPRMTATFGVHHTAVSVRIGQFVTPANPAVATMTAYDASGALVATPAPVALAPGAGIHALLAVTTATPTIIGIRIDLRDSDQGNLVAIDDLTFDTPVTPPVPDFTLSTPTTFVNVRQGASLAIPIAVGRIGGSTGPVTLALTTPCRPASPPPSRRTRCRAAKRPSRSAPPPTRRRPAGRPSA